MGKDEKNGLVIEQDAAESFDDLFADKDTAEHPVVDAGKWKLLIVDDEPEIHRVTRMVLQDFIFEGKALDILGAFSGKEAEKVLVGNPDMAVILLDVVMEEEDAGLKLVKYIREALHYDFVRIVLRTGQPGQAPEEKVIVEYDISDYKEKTELTSTKLVTCIVTSLRAYRLNRAVEDTQREVVFALSEIAEARSRETGHHVKRVAEITKLLAVQSGLHEREAEILKLASPMHDIGKLAIPDAILNKPGKLTEREFAIMKTHAMAGFEMLRKTEKSIMKAAALVALQHHEKYNGQGYPHGLKGEQIHIYGRIVAIADVFDALFHDRVYRKAWDIEKIKKLLREESGNHFDPVLVAVFLANLDEIIRISTEWE